MMRLLHDDLPGIQTILQGGPLDGDVIPPPFSQGDRDGIICPIVQHPDGRVLLLHSYRIRETDPTRADFVKTTFAFFDDGRGNPQLGPMRELMRRLDEIGGPR